MSYYFRVDSNENIGIGHMMRCLSIARAMRQMGQEATFFVADRKSAAIAAQNGFGYYCLNTDYDHLDVEADKFIQIIRDREAENLLVDSYFVTENYLNKIREVTNLTYIDDINRFIYPCNLLVNYNIYADSLDYERRYRAAGLDTEFALGLSYMPLRDEFRDLAKVREKRLAERRAGRDKGTVPSAGNASVSTLSKANTAYEHPGDPYASEDSIHVMLTTGATDRFNVLGKILEKAEKHGLLQESDGAGSAALEFAVIVGQYNSHRDELAARFGKYFNVHLMEPQPTLADLIASSDIAVTAGGTTVYELCAGGIPSVMLTIADNQMRAAKEFSARGIIPYAGDVRGDIDDVAEKVVAQTEAYAGDETLRDAAGEKMRSVVDGQGADRLAKLLISRMK